MRQGCEVSEVQARRRPRWPMIGRPVRARVAFRLRPGCACFHHHLQAFDMSLSCSRTHPCLRFDEGLGEPPYPDAPAELTLCRLADEPYTLHY